MNRSICQLTVFLLCMTWSLQLTAEPPKKLAEVCPRLQIPGEATRPGATNEPIIIDNAMVRRFAQQGRFAAIGPSAATGEAGTRAPATVNKNRTQSKTRDRWRAEYRREVAAIRKLTLRLTIARHELDALEDQYFAASSEAQRIRMEPRLNRKKLEIRDLDYSLRKQRAVFSRLIREARQDGAQPGWFRDLPRP